MKNVVSVGFRAFWHKIRKNRTARGRRSIKFLKMSANRRDRRAGKSEARGLPGKAPKKMTERA